jgi:hypothetical protein
MKNDSLPLQLPLPLLLPLLLPLSAAKRSKSTTEFHHPSLWLIKEGFGRSV